MSLIVANAIDNALFLMSDTKLTLKNHNTNPYIEGGVKITILDGNRCIAFAGLYQTAQDVIKELKPSISDDDIVKSLIKATNREDVEFIFATIEPIPRIIKITNGCSQDCITTWIGDSDGFYLYQKFFTGWENSDKIYEELTRIQFLLMPEGCSKKENDLYSKMFNCMCAVVDSKEVDSVGGFTIPVYTSNRCLSFGNYCSIFRKPIAQHELTQNPTPISFGDAATGSFSVNFTGLKRKKIAVHIVQGQIGIIFNSSDNVLEPELLTNIDEIDFSKVINEKFDTNLGGLIASSPWHYFKKAEKLMKNNDFQLAIQFLTEGIKISSKEWKGVPHNTSFRYESLETCLEKEGPPLKISTKEAPLLKSAFFMRGFSRFALQNFQSALQDFKESLTLDEGFYNALFWRAKAEHALNDYPSAIETIKKCCELHSRFKAFHFCGQLLLLSGDLFGAKYYFNRAQEHNLKKQISNGLKE